MNKDKSEQQSQQGIVEGWEEKLREILKGIDTDDFEPDGWWETSTGAKFGAEKFKEVEKLFSFNLAQQAQKTRKETLEEAYNTIKKIPPSNATVYGLMIAEYELQSLINNQ
jgi:hypothetical protein